MLATYTERLMIRPLRSSDFQSWKLSLLSFHPSKNKWDAGRANEKSVSREEFRKLLKGQRLQRQQDSHYIFGVFMKKSEKFIGSTALMDISRGVFQNAYLGYWIGNTSWGQGLGIEAVKATIQIGCSTLQLHRIEAGIEPQNRRSIRLAKSLKMRREGMSRRRLFLRGGWQDLVLYAMTSEELGITCSSTLKISRS